MKVWHKAQSVLFGLISAGYMVAVIVDQVRGDPFGGKASRCAMALQSTSLMGS